MRIFPLLLLPILFSSAPARADNSFLNFIAQTGAKLNTLVQNTIHSYTGDCDPAFNSNPWPTPDPNLPPPPSPPPQPPMACESWGYEQERPNSMLTDTLLIDGVDAEQEKSRLSCMTWALEHGAIADGTDPDMRPLILAVRNNHPEAVKLLLAHGANPNITESNGVTPLVFAAYDLQDETLAALLDAGADPNKNDDQHSSALYGAVAKADLTAVKLLLAHQAKTNPIIKFGSDQEPETPLDGSAADLIILKNYVDEKPASEDLDKELQKYDIDRVRADHAPQKELGVTAPEPRSLDQIYSDQQAINALLKSSGGICATNPCGGIIGASEDDLTQDSDSTVTDKP